MGTHFGPGFLGGVQDDAIENTAARAVHPVYAVHGWEGSAQHHRSGIEFDGVGQRSARGGELVQQTPPLEERTAWNLKLVRGDGVAWEFCFIYKENFVAHAGQKEGRSRSGAACSNNNRVVHGMSP